MRDHNYLYLADPCYPTRQQNFDMHKHQLSIPKSGLCLMNCNNNQINWRSVNEINISKQNMSHFRTIKFWTKRHCSPKAHKMTIAKSIWTQWNMENKGRLCWLGKGKRKKGQIGLIHEHGDISTQKLCPGSTSVLCFLLAHCRRPTCLPHIQELSKWKNYSQSNSKQFPQSPKIIIMEWDGDHILESWTHKYYTNENKKEKDKRHIASMEMCINQETYSDG